ncbi:MAG: FAD-binding oxidoreductase [Actinomycetota bacterium]|nr:FAD-binding oxidoreductase [Actinomycetota bacterium]
MDVASPAVPAARSGGNPGRAEVAVIGAGIIGMSTAWHLSRRGLDVVVVDKVGVGSGMTGLQPGGIRTQWASRESCEMALESQRFYERFADETGTGHDPGLDHCGYCFIASTQATLEMLAEAVRQQNSLGVSSVMLGPDDLAELVPGLATDELAGGSFNPQDGYLDRPGAPVAGFAEAAEASGASLVISQVERIDEEGATWSLRLTGGGRITAPHVVIAAGMGSVELCESVGITLPLEPEPRYLFYSPQIKPCLVKPLLVFQDEHFAVKHLADGSVLASDLSIPPDAEIDEQRWRDNVTDAAHRLVPVLSYVRFPTMVTGIYDVTPDAQLLVGPLSGRDGIVLAAGMNGRGLMVAPSVGRMVTELVLGDTSGVPESLLPDRFSEDSASVTAAPRGESMVI